MERFDDIVYGADPDWQKLDIYRPKAASGENLPVILSIHGGGWVYGDKERYQFYCMSLAQRGFAVVNYTYRLAPEFKFPAQMEDTNLVASWIMEEQLKAKGVPYESLMYGDDQEKLGHVFHLDVKSDRAAQCNDAECAFFRKYLRN